MTEKSVHTRIISAVQQPKAIQKITDPPSQFTLMNPSEELQRANLLSHSFPPQQSVPQMWQVFFLPKSDTSSQQVIVAFCPFTKVYAEGQNVIQAADNWKAAAQTRFTNVEFNINGYVDRKVWFGENGEQQIVEISEQNSKPVYIIDFSFIESATAFCPATTQLLVGKIDDWKTSDDKSVEFLPSLWLERAVTCTPLKPLAVQSISLPSNILIGLVTVQQRKKQKISEERVVEIVEEEESQKEKESEKVSAATPSDTTTVEVVKEEEKEVEEKELVHKQKQQRTIDYCHPDFIIQSTYENSTKFHQWIDSDCLPMFISNTFKCNKVNQFSSLSTGYKRILNSPNAGGNSIWSECLSYEILNCCYGAQLHKTEMEIEYFPSGGKMTDFSIELYGKHYGVSVTRAMKFKGTFTEKDAIQLLTKKMTGVIESTRCVSGNQKFTKQILFIWTQHEYISAELERVWRKMDRELQSNTLIICTCGSDHPKIFH